MLLWTAKIDPIYGSPGTARRADEANCFPISDLRDTAVARTQQNVARSDTGTRQTWKNLRYCAGRRGAEVASLGSVAETTIPVPDRRTVANGNDRRKNSLSGRRSTDPRFKWRRAAWRFAAYALYLSARSLPASVKKFFVRSPS